MSESGSTSSSRPSAAVPRAEPSRDQASPDQPVGAAPPENRPPELPAPDDRTVISDSPPIAHPVDRLGLIPPDDRQAFEGVMLGHFRIEQFVGGGGMGAVYRALDTRLNRPVAVKILSGEPYGDEDVERRFKNEAQSAARLDHENIARVYYFGVERGVHFIAFEFIEGINVRDLVAQRGPLPLAEAVSYTLQVADALAHANRRDVVHRDIKPSNVLVTAEGRAKLVDMGLARLHQVECSEADLTASGVTLGTFDYISPEQARDPRAADIRSDLYSLGCTFFYMLTGQPPFPEGTVLQKLLRHQGDDAPDPRLLRDDLPEQVAGIVRRLLAKSPEDRFPEPESLIKALLTVARQIGLPAAIPGGTVWVTTDITQESWLLRHLPWIVPTALLVMGVWLLEVFWPTHDVLPLNRTSVKPIAAARPPEAPGTAAAAGAVPLPEPAGPAEGGLTGTAKPSVPLVAPVAPEPAEEAIVVAPATDGQRPRSYDSLREAVREAASGDVIELRFNGRRNEAPVRLVNKRLTIRAGKGFRPQVVFRLDPENTYPVGPSRSMISVLGGDLTLVNVYLEMEVPRGTTSESVSLLQTRGAESVRLDRCWLTVVNQYDYEGVAFLDVRSAPGGEATHALAPEQVGQRPVKIRLENCVARGEATFLHSAEMQPIDLFWRNGFLATSQRFFELDAGHSLHDASGQLQADLQYITAVMQGGFMFVDGGELALAVPVELAVRDSILVGERDAPLIELRGAGRSESLRRSMVWQGDRNFYEGFRDFWLLQDAAEDRPLHIDYPGWTAAWNADRYGHENSPHFAAVVWQSPPSADKLPHQLTPADFRLLDGAGENPARGAAGDGSDAGFRQDLWPPPPAGKPFAPPLPTSHLPRRRLLPAR